MIYMFSIIYTYIYMYVYTYTYADGQTVSVCCPHFQPAKMVGSAGNDGLHSGPSCGTTTWTP